MQGLPGLVPGLQGSVPGLTGLLGPLGMTPSNTVTSSLTVPTHSSPSKPRSGQTPSENMSAMSAQSSHLPFTMSHTSLTSPTVLAKSHMSLTSPSSQAWSGPEQEIFDIKARNSVGYPCKYCSNSFPSYKTLKSKHHLCTLLNMKLQIYFTDFEIFSLINACHRTL